MRARLPLAMLALVIALAPTAARADRAAALIASAQTAEAIEKALAEADLRLGAWIAPEGQCPPGSVDLLGVCSGGVQQSEPDAATQD